MKRTLLLLLIAASSILANVDLVQRVVIEFPEDLCNEGIGSTLLNAAH